MHLDATFQDLLATGAKNVFLFFAFVIWPVWTPFALWMAEPSAWRKQVMSACFGIGLALVSFLMLTIPNTSAIAYHNSIQYLLEWKNVPHEMPVRAITLFFYGIATLLPFFFSSLRKIWILGLLTALAGLITFLIDRYLFTSMWCFFAAAISMSLFFTLPKRKR